MRNEAMRRPIGLSQDGELVARAQGGEDEAFEGLFHRHKDRIYTVAYTILGNQSDANDIVQETFLRAYRRLNRLRKDGAIVSYLCKTARNAAIDLLRANGNARPDPLDGSDASSIDPVSHRPGPDAELRRQIDNDALGVAIAELNPDHRVVVVMHHIEDLPVDEIATELQIPVGTVKSRLGRARAALRRKLIGPLGRSDT